MLSLSRPKLSGSAAARRKIEHTTKQWQIDNQNKLAQLSAEINKNAADLPEHLRDVFPYVECMTTAIQQLNALLDTKPKRADQSKLRTYVISRRTLSDIHQYVTSDKDGHELMMIGTGPETADGTTTVISEMQPVRTSSKSATFVAAHAGHTAVQIDDIATSGHKLWIMAHSHIMRGRNSTRPSQTDIAHQERMTEHGRPEMLGCIVSLDGWVRIYSTARPFHLHVHGNGVTVTDDNPREKILKLDIAEAKHDLPV